MKNDYFGSYKDRLKFDLNLLLEEQNIVNKRIKITKETLEEIPSTDPQYSILKDQIDIDRINLDELQKKVVVLEKKIKETI